MPQNINTENGQADPAGHVEQTEPDTNISESESVEENVLGIMEDSGISPYVDDSIGTELEGQHEVAEILPQDLSNPEEIEKRAQILAENALALYPTERQQQALDERYNQMVELLVGIAQQLGANDRLLDMIRNLDTISAARRILQERNKLAFGLIHLLEATETSVTFTIQDMENKRVYTERPTLTINNISDTELLMRNIEYLIIDIKSVQESYALRSTKLAGAQRYNESLHSQVTELKRLLHDAEEKRDSYSKTAGDVIRHPLRGFGVETPVWVLRHKIERDIYIGLTNLGKRREPMLLDFVPVQGLRFAYRVIGGENGSPELRDLMERFAEQKFFQRVQFEDFQIEKITTQIYGT